MNAVGETLLPRARRRESVMGINGVMCERNKGFQYIMPLNSIYTFIAELQSVCLFSLENKEVAVIYVTTTSRYVQINIKF